MDYITRFEKLSMWSCFNFRNRFPGSFGYLYGDYDESIRPHGRCPQKFIFLGGFYNFENIDMDAVYWEWPNKYVYKITKFSLQH